MKFSSDKCIASCTHSDSIIENSFTILKIPCVPIVSPSLISTTTNLFMVFLVLPFPKRHIVGVKQ